MMCWRLSVAWGRMPELRGQDGVATENPFSLMFCDNILKVVDLLRSTVVDICSKFSPPEVCLDTEAISYSHCAHHCLCFYDYLSDSQ